MHPIGALDDHWLRSTSFGPDEQNRMHNARFTIFEFRLGLLVARAGMRTIHAPSTYVDTVLKCSERPTFPSRVSLCLVMKLRKKDPNPLMVPS